MKRILLAAAAVLAISSAAQAEGFYVGGNVAHEGTEFQTVDAGGKLEASARGPSVGLFAGYNYSFGKYLLGLEAAYEYADAEFDLGAGGQLGFDHTFTLGARAGYQLNGDTLVYGLGAFEKARYEATVPGFAKETAYVDGLRLGFGTEYSLTKDFFLRGEYTYTWTEKFDLGGEVDATRGIAKVGAGYRF